MNESTLSKQFNTKSLILYALPTIVMMIFMSTYTIVDGIFVSNFINEYALSAVNVVLPVITFTMAIAMMFATGASAVIGKLLGERKTSEAKSFLSIIYIVGIVFGIILTALVLIFYEPILGMLGASDILLPYAKDYLLTITPFLPIAFLQIFTQCFFVTAGKPILGFIACLLGGITNIILDYVFIVPLNMGIAGAALATGIGFSIPGIFGLIYFMVKRNGSLFFAKPKWNGKQLFASMYNGMSEFINSVAISITTLLFNVTLLRIAGENGIAAVSVILYVQMMQSAVFMGYSMGVAPVISYKFGEKNSNQLALINKISFKFIGTISFIIILVSMVFAEQAVGIFIDSTSETFSLATTGFRIFSIAYVFMGFNIYASALFTALSNGKVSAILSFVRSLVFIVIALITLPFILGITGVWLAVPIAEALAVMLSFYYYRKYKKTYNY